MADLAWVPAFGTHMDGVHALPFLRLPAVMACSVGSVLCDREGWGPMSPVRDFDLTPCFQAVVLWMLPALVFLCAAVGALRELRARDRIDRSESSLHLLHDKVGVTAVILVLAFVEFAALIGLRGYLTGPEAALGGGLQVLSAGVMFVAYVAALLLQCANHLCEQHSSDAVVMFWLMHLLVGPVRLRTLMLLAPSASASQLLLVVPLCMRLLFVCVALGLNCMDLEVDEGIALPEGELELPEGVDVEEIEVDEHAAAASPLDTANLFSRLSFAWMQPMMSLGAQRFLNEHDMWALPRGEETHDLGNYFQHHWAVLTAEAAAAGEEPSATGKRRFWFAMLRAFGRPFYVAAGYKVVQDSLAFVQPQLLRALIAFVERWELAPVDANVRGTALRGYVLAALLFITAIMQTAALHQYFQLVGIAGMRARAGIISALFRKSLRLSSQARASRTTGDMMNLMSVDANRLPDFIMYAHILWSAVFQITIAFVSLYHLLGWSAFVGVAIMVVSVPLNTALATYLRRLSAAQMKVRDRRTSIMNEIVINIKSIKLFAWEEAFTRRLLDVRNGEELPLLQRIGVASAGFNFFWQAIPFFVSLGTFIVYSMTSTKPLTADIAFPALALYQLLNFPLSMLAGIVSMFLQTQVSAGRLADFFDCEELDESARKLLPMPSDGTERPRAAVAPHEAVRMRKASFAWTKDQAVPTLQELDLTLRAGELVAVLGRVGEGKSSLLSAILGDMVRTGGRLVVQGQTAYFSQGGWAMGATVRDNILFGREYDEAHYRHCIAACALEPDLAMLDAGDLTEIGERGVSLSGGQRARVALARACYAMADIYLLDDPLAAVDAHVGAHLWQHVLGPQGLLRHKTRVLTTNAVSYLHACDRILTMRSGRLLPEQGTFDEVMAMRGDVYRLISGLGRRDEPGAPAEASAGADAAAAAAPLARPRMLSRAEIRAVSQQQLTESSAPRELQASGSVKWDVYKRYIHSASAGGVVLYFVSHAVTQAFSVSRDVVLKEWSAANTRFGNVPGTATRYLTLYALAGLATSIGVCVAPMILYVWLVLRSARHFHDGLFLRLLHYPLQWFERTPTGRLLNLFSRDVSVIDEVLPRVIQGMTRSLMVVIGVLCVVSYSVPAFLLVVIPLGMAYRRIMLYYLASSRELKRLDAVTKSPVFTWFQEALGGLPTIRAFAQDPGFAEVFEMRVDRNQMCYFPAISCNRWLAVRIEMLGSCILFFASTVAVYLITSNGRMSAGLLGLMLSQVLSTTQTLNWTVRSASEVEQNIVSVERVLQYSELPTEAAYLGTAPLPPKWPERGVVEFRNYSTRYREDLEPVLKHISFTTRPHERIGVVGRTGAGKSSLTLALFRILEATEGAVYIDGIDISTLGLYDLRQAMAIIPQDAQLWQGTLRQNLDPLLQFTDSELITVLANARLSHLVAAHPLGLAQPVSEAGANFSAGQRQLICIARAMVRRSSILVLDEATSSIDLDTDRLVQEIVRTQFDATTITIAHRLNTILDSSRVLVLSNGKVSEFAPPDELLRNDTSLFYSMAAEAGLWEAIAQARGESVAEARGEVAAEDAATAAEPHGTTGDAAVPRDSART